MLYVVLIIFIKPHGETVVITCVVRSSIIVKILLVGVLLLRACILWLFVLLPSQLLRRCKQLSSSLLLCGLQTRGLCCCS